MIGKLCQQTDTPKGVPLITGILPLFCEADDFCQAFEPEFKDHLHLTRNLYGKLIGDRGYISQKLFEWLFGRGVQLITKIKLKMKNRLMPMLDKLLLRKRALIETINDQLKNICQIEHSRHRSPTNFVVNTLAALIAYTFKEKKPSLNLRVKELEKLTPALVWLCRTHVILVYQE